MEFKQFAQLVHDRFSEIAKGGQLFVSTVSGQDLWDLYLNSFRPEDNYVFRDPASTVNNCNLDKSFIRRYGNVVGIDANYNIVTMWDIALEESCEYYRSAKALTARLKEAPIANIFIETFDELNSLPYEKCTRSQAVYRLGFPQNNKVYTPEEAAKFGKVTAGKPYTFYHFYADLPKNFVDQTGKSAATIQGVFRDDALVFQRAMLEIPLDTLILVKDLITQGSLLDGQTHLKKIDTFIPLKQEFDALAPSQRNTWVWVKSHKLAIARFKNELIGVLCSELSEGMELNLACQNWNKRVDPVNYMKAKAPITPKQIKEAKDFVEANGYLESFDRRLATIEDIDVNEILHSNVGDVVVKNASVFDKVQASAPSTRFKRSQFDKVETVPIEKFMSDILPTCTSVEVLMENRLENNLVALTTARVLDSKPIFKWSNNFSWTFRGNLAGKSQIKEAVKVAGGKVDGVMRFSMIWNEAGQDNSDLDAWCEQPNNERIGFSTDFRKDRYNARLSSCGGQLDLDNTGPGSKVGIENIYFKDKRSLKNGVYRFWVNQFSARNSQGFRAEIEVDGEIYTYTYDRPVSGNVVVAEVTYTDGVFTVNHKLAESASSRVLWGVETGAFHKVNLVCLTPNHWGTNNVGNKHYLFMMDACQADTPLRAFHNENLNSDLLQHRKVMEVLGQSAMTEPTAKHLAGVGFNATVRDEVILRLGGSFKRTIKVTF